MEAAAGLTALVDAATAFEPRFLTASDEELLADLDAVEQLGRRVDALRAAAAGEVARRSVSSNPEYRLSFRCGAKDGIQLVERVTRISYWEAKRRVGIGCSLAPVLGLDGTPHPGRFAAVADAVTSGAIGIEAARSIVNLVKANRRKADPADLDAAVAALIQSAQEVEADAVRELGFRWSEGLDPDGGRPEEQARRAARRFTLGSPRLDGMTRASVLLLPEHAALFREVLQSRRRTIPLLRTVPGSDQDEDTTGGEWREDTAEPRTRAQQDYDTLIEVVDAGMHAETVDTTSGVVHEVVVTVTAAELEARGGRGYSAGVLAGIPIPTIERQACTGGTRLLVTGDQGEPLYLSRKHRLFTSVQKRALTVAAGDRCQYPGCRCPAPYLEAHHVDWWARDGGRTRVDNGIMLCSFHHHLIHAKDSPARIVRHRGALHVVPARWRGDPLPRHRAQTRAHPAAAPPAHRDRVTLRQRTDPPAAESAPYGCRKVQTMPEGPVRAPVKAPPTLRQHDRRDAVKACVTGPKRAAARIAP